MISLLDVNVLIALCDPAHKYAAVATRFFQDHARREGWATCPLVENGLLRIFGARNYPGGPGSPQDARHIFASLKAQPGHQFWSDEISLVDLYTYPQLPASRHLTDFYLLALAVKRKGRLVTFDSKIDPATIPGGPAAFYPLV